MDNNIIIERLRESRNALIARLYWDDNPDSAVVRTVNTLTDIMIDMGWNSASRIGHEENGYVILWMQEPDTYYIYDLNVEEKIACDSLEDMNYYIANDEYKIDED